MKWVVLAILVSGCVWSFMVAQILSHWPSATLKDRSKGLYRLSGYGWSARLTLWLIGTFCLACLLFVTYNHFGWLAGLVVVAASALVFAWQPARQPNAVWRVAGLSAMPLAYVLGLAEPATRSLNQRFSGSGLRNQPTGLHDKSDLLQLLRRQSKQASSQVSPADLEKAAAALSFGDKAVSQVMLPVAEVKWLAASEPISPAIMDELHKTGQSRFALVKNAKASQPEIVGTLYIGDVLKNLDQSAKLKSLMQAGVQYIKISETLESALLACLSSGQLLLIVVDDHQQVVGQLSIEQILAEVLGPFATD